VEGSSDSEKREFPQVRRSADRGEGKELAACIKNKPADERESLSKVFSLLGEKGGVPMQDREIATDFLCRMKPQTYSKKEASETNGLGSSNLRREI